MIEMSMEIIQDNRPVNHSGVVVNKEQKLYLPQGLVTCHSHLNSEYAHCLQIQTELSHSFALKFITMLMILWKSSTIQSYHIMGQK